MFRQRTSAQKPADDLLADFKQQFPEVSTVNTEPPAPAVSQTTTATENPIIISAPAQERTLHVGNDVFRDMDPTPRASNDPWRFTPSLLDPSAFSFSSFPNSVPGYYTPTSGGGTSTLLPPPQATGLHPPSLAMTTGLDTPLSVPTTAADAIQPSIEVPSMVGFQPLEPHHMHHYNFGQAPQPSFVPSNFAHIDTGYETMDQDGSPMESDPSEERMPAIAAALHPHRQPTVSGLPMGDPLPAAADKFRFHATLNAPTAMVKHADEIPVTYLNKGQTYSLSIVDTNGTVPITLPGTRYRTYVRISFEDDQQRQKAGVCWSLWKEGRGTNEAHNRGGKLQAVEYVEAGQPAEGDDRRTRVELESHSFDGFSVIWMPGMNGAPDVSIAVRFNFLSTDFSHSKGVKGIPVRLCAKTNPLTSSPTQAVSDMAPEICFCKVKLFRDHGAERKLSNDVAHVKKSIDKLKQQVAQAESGLKDFGKRKRAGGSIKGEEPPRPGKVHKHKRTWSMSSASSAGGGGARIALDEDLHFKLQTLQDMFTSTRPISVLYLRGDELDDPDLHPVSLQGDTPLSHKADLLREGPSWQARSTHSSVAGSLVSPSPSSLSLASQASAVGCGAQWQILDPAGAGDVSRKRRDQPITISKTEDDGTLSGWIETLDVDPLYRPPPERPPKAVACFYVMHHGTTEPGTRDYHRAIYLSERTLKELNGRIAAKWGLEPCRIVQTTYLTKAGIEVEVDDDMVEELKEGQDMKLEIEEVVEQASTNREWAMSLDGPDESNEAAARAEASLALRLVF